MSNNDIQRAQKRSADRPSYNTFSTLDGIFHWGLVTISFLAPLVFLKHIHEFTNLPQSAFIQVGVVFLLFVWLMKSFINKKCFILKSPLNLPLLAFVLWSLASIIYAHNKYEGFLAWSPWAASALMFFLVVNGSHEKRRLIQVLAAIYISCSLCALLGIAQHLFGFTWVPQTSPPAATFANKNMAVHFVVLTMPLVVGFIVNSKQQAWAWIAGAASCLMIVFILYTKTRAAWVAVGVEFLLLVILLARERIQNREVPYWSRKKGILAGLTIVVLFVMMNFGPKGFTWRLGEIVERVSTMTSFEVEPSEWENIADKTIALRIAIWRNTVEMIKDHPWIGLGLGNHKVFYPLYHGKTVKDREFSVATQLRRVHNDFLQAFAELGIVGMLLLGWIGFVCIRIALNLTSSRYSSDVRFWTIGITLGIVGLLVNAFFSFPFQRAIPPFYLMIFTGILASFHEGDNRKFYAIGQRWVMLCSCVIIFMGLIWVVRFHYLGIRCDRLFHRLTRFERSRNWQSLVATGEKAYSRNPARIKTLSLVGRAYIETGEYQKGIEALRKVIDAYPYFMNALVNIGVAYDRIGDNEKALESYERVLFIKTDYPRVHNSMANIYMRQGNLGKALKKFKSAAELDSNNSVVHFNIGALEMRNGRYQEAAAAFEKAVGLKPRWALARKNLGLIYLQFLDRREEGLEQLRKALKLDPDMKDAARIRKLISIPSPKEEKMS
jgi:O-antigen ligase/Tfp pilus assembly protein PilF